MYISINRYNKCVIHILPFLLATVVSYSHAAPPAWDAKRILGSKHDLTRFNERAEVEAMGGVAFSDYGDACIYCHLEPEKEDSDSVGQIEGWNRLRPQDKSFKFYSSNTATQKQEKLGTVTQLCLSCHDGSMAVDRVVHKPSMWTSDEEATLHMRLNASDDLNSCGKCHQGGVGHNIKFKVIGKDLSDDHPISIKYAGFNTKATGFNLPDGVYGFKNGVRLYDKKIECATCHDVHDPDAKMLLRTNPEQLCLTCHTK